MFLKSILSILHLRHFFLFELNMTLPSFEKIVDSRELKRIEADKKIWSKSIEGINLSDILIINNWIKYAEMTGDKSYKQIYEKDINNNFVSNLLGDQLEFRRKEFKSI